MNKNMMNNIGLLGIIVLMITMLIACDSESGGETTPPAEPSNLYAWGFNFYGQLGIGNNSDQATPVAIGTKTWKLVSAGAGHTMAINSDDHLFAWGSNAYGQLGDGNGGSVEDKSTTPVPIESAKTWKLVSAGAGHTMAIDTDDHLFAWGSNAHGQLGIGTETVNGSEVLVDKYTPFQVGTKTWTQVSAGAGHTVAIDNLGKLYTWGYNDFGQLGNGNKTNQNTPVAIETTKTWTLVSTGESFNSIGTLTGYTMAIDNLDKLYAWGRNRFGQFGNNNTTDSTTPVQIGTKTWTLVSAGEEYTIAIDTDDHLFAWGYNGKGQLGNGNTTDSTTPIAIEPTKTWTQVSAGGAHTMAIDTDNHLFAWGYNNSGQLGNGNKTDQNTPVAIEPNKTWTQVSAGNNSTLGIIQEQEDTP